jgi:hypothetical protein
MKKITEDNKTDQAELKEMSQKMFAGLVKAVVDVEKEVMVIDADLHADEEKVLLEDGSKQENLWGINFYPDLINTDDFIEFDSMINIHPWQNNRSRGVEDVKVQEKIKAVVRKLVS